MTKHFDISESGHLVLWYPGVGFIVFIICFTLFIYFQFKASSKQQRRLSLFLTLFSFMWTLIWWIGVGTKYNQCMNALETDHFNTVEGMITDFVPMPKEGHQKESFKVEGIEFNYSDYEPSCGFHNTKSHGGPIDQGKYVKINYYKGLILQLWIKN